MNYDEEINRLSESIKNDKSIVQPWRNKAKARLEEAQAFVRMGQTSTNLQPPEDPGSTHAPMQFASPGTSTSSPAFGQQMTPVCNCAVGWPPRKDCAVHGS